jgi:hypothetical protein
MTDAVAPPYLDRAVLVAKMAKALKGAPDAILLNAHARYLSYDNAGVWGTYVDIPLNHLDLDKRAVASELARRKFMGQTR